MKKIVYGFLFGISCLIPGFSGGTMLLILGIYESFTSSLSKLLQKPKEAFGELWLYGIGASIGIVVGTFTIANSLQYFPFIIASFFVGLVLATIPITLRKINIAKMKIIDILSYLVAIFISMILTFSDDFNISYIQLKTPSISLMIYILILTAIASATMVIPAASGMTILLIFGMYEPLMLIFDQVFKDILKLNFISLRNNLWILLTFIIGAIIGVVGISKIISNLFKKNVFFIWYFILGLLVVSPITIYKAAYEKQLLYMNNFISKHFFGHLVLCIIFLIVGIFLITFLNYLQKKHKTKNKDK